MTAAEIDAYLADLPKPKRSTLQALRTSILAVIPDDLVRRLVDAKLEILGF